MAKMDTDSGTNGYRYNVAVEHFRAREYPMLQDSVYLDHAGTTLCSKSLMNAFTSSMMETIYGNPHSASPSSQNSTSRIEDARMNLLNFFGADPAEYDVVFVANATAGVKLVVDAMRTLPQGFLYAYHEACHTSLVGAREEAIDSSLIDDGSLQSWLKGNSPFMDTAYASPPSTLFSYSAQSHMDGKRYPLTWSRDLREAHRNSKSGLLTLLDASSFAATSRLDLSDPNITPDFIVVSLYKIFGFPDLGALLVRRSSEWVFDHRKYFGGGTVDMVVCGKEKWHAPKSHSLHERLEDGTLPFHSIIALDIAMEVHERLFGTMDEIKSHTSYLSRRLLRDLIELRHVNGEPVCAVYTKDSSGVESLGTGPVVSFNLRNSRGAWVSLTEFEKLANLKKMHIRTGGLCSPGGIASALGLQPWEMKRNFSAGFRCGADNDIMSGKPTGVIRASLGAMSTKADVDRFVDFIKEFYLETTLPTIEPIISTTSPTVISEPPRLQVKTITIYPIKSCAGFSIPPRVSWEIRPEGLAWDREWCLVHHGSGHALNQKRCPRMALLRPRIDFDKGELVVSYHGKRRDNHPHQISIPLSADPSVIDSTLDRQRSRVCGEEVSAQLYTSESINGFFSSVLGVPCVLARFPPGGLGLKSRLSKAQIQRYQQPSRMRTLPGAFPDVPSPPDSDSEQKKPAKILLSNESPILMIHSSSVDELNREIMGRGGSPVEERAFRANIVLEHAPGTKAYTAFAEDDWGSVHIGRQNFKLLGACHRCQMVCIDQETGEKREEPFVTLAKTRRFDGKVYFGVHMRHDSFVQGDCTTKETQYPTIEVGDSVSVKPRD
ncbi:Molybdenum cofactor sulfurase [Fusarium keratoplasticum]|uniref:Molybdenum cofactor sulfurase n=1 Tax=Fusarium keratoplasticum TaxID=1328300 RepID=A0ACC0REY4_9HYPO|nr:Molybdenum cofactor sulfurase [Fusarium keratoplasticum]KAI8684075.1 Molybdenum cofactor sulfurase [Fusarium keratoplasticum]KAI8688188.1 Molybdenum cofactor sulfurase [Fusarium keratoplasticum]